MPKVDFAKLKEWFEDSRRATSKWRKDAKEWYDFRSGEQWSAEDKELLAEQLRPMITFNRTGPQVDSVCGLEINNRHEITCQPRELGDVKTSERDTGAIKWVRDNCDAEDEESQAFEDCIISGLGAVETFMDYDENPEGDVIMNRVDPNEMYWQGSARKVNLSDSKYVFRVKKMPLEDAKEIFETEDDSTLNATWAAAYKLDGDAEQIGPVDQYPTEESDSNSDDKKTADVTIVEAQWFERERVHLITDPFSGEKRTIKKDEHKLLKQRIDEIGANWDEMANPGRPVPTLDSVPMMKKVFKRAFLGADILKQEEGPCPDSFTYKFITGKQNRNNGALYGILKAMQDPQRWANKWLSQTMHILNVNPKGGVMAESDAVPNWAQFEASWSNPSMVTKVSPGAISGGKLKEKTSPGLPAGLDKLLAFAIDSIPQVTGINPDAIGLADRNQPGVLEHMRKQSMMTNLAGYFSHLRKYRKEQGRLLLHFINEYISDGRLIRIEGQGQDKAKYVPLERQPGAIEYDIIIDDSPTSPDTKTANWGIIEKMMPIIAQLGVPPEIWTTIMQYSPLPSSLTDKVNALMTQAAQQKQGQGPPPDPKMLEVKIKGLETQARLEMDQQKLEIELQQLAADVEKTKSETLKNIALAEAAELGPQFEQYKIQMAQLSQDMAHQQGMAKQQQAQVAQVVAQHQAQQDQMAQAQQGHQQQMAQGDQGHQQELSKMQAAADLAPPPQDFSGAGGPS